MKTKNLLPRIDGATTVTTAKRKRSGQATSNQSQLTKVRHVSDNDLLDDDSHDANLKTVALFEDFSEWTNNWRAFQYQRLRALRQFDITAATKAPNEKYQSGYFTLGQQYTLLCINHRPSSKPLTLFKSLKKIAVRLNHNDSVLTEALNKICESLEQLDVCFDYKELTATDKIFLDQFCAKMEAIDSFLQTNFLEFSNIESEIQQLLQPIKQSSGYFEYSSVFTSLRQSILTRLDATIASCQQKLTELKDDYEYMELPEINPILIQRAKSVLDDRILLMDEDIRSYQAKIDSVNGYCHEAKSLITELEEIANLLFELERRIPDNNQLAQDIEQAKLFRPGLAI